MRYLKTIVGLLVSLLTIPMCSVLAQPLRFSEHYDLNNGAGGFLSGIYLGNDTLLVVGYSLNLSTNSGYDEGHHIVVGSEGELIDEYQLSAQEISYKTNNIIRSAYSDAIFSAGSHCDYTVPSPGYCDFYFARLDETGDTLFTEVIARPDTSDLLLSMVETKPNRIMLIGWTYNDTTDTDADILLITVDTLGNEVNRVVYGGGGTDFISDGVVVDSSGNVIMAGYTKSFPSISNSIRTWVIRTDSIGNVTWQRTYSGALGLGSSSARIAKLPNGNLIVAGGSQTFGSSSFGVDATLMEIDTAGNPIWAKEYEVPNGQGLWGVVGLDDGTIVSCGVTDNGNDQAGWLIKTDENGDTLWTRTYDPSDATDYLRNMLVMPNGDIVMVGFGRGENSTTQDGWILRVDSMGCEVENCFMVGIEEFEDEEQYFSVYPNPFSGTTTVEYACAERYTECSIRILDLTGKVLKHVPLRDNENGTYTLNMTDFAQGIYYCALYGDDSLIDAKKLIHLK